MKNKKGFTMIELLATIAIMGVLATIAVVSMSKFINHTKDTTYQEFEETLKDSTANYLLYNTGLIPDVGGSYKVMASQLTSEGYLDNLTDPQDKTATCNSNSYIIVKRNSDVDFNMDLDYKVCLICSKYKSSTCS